MAGFMIPGQSYQDPSTGKWGTAQQHAAWKAEASAQQAYNVDKPSAPAANAAAQQANPNLDFTIGPTGQTSYTNQSVQQKALAEQQAKNAAAAAQSGYTNQTTQANNAAAHQKAQAQAQAQAAALAAQGQYKNQTAQSQLQAKVAAEAAQGSYANQTSQTQLQGDLAATAAQGSYANQTAQTNRQAEIAAAAAQQGQTWKEQDRASFLGLLNQEQTGVPPPVSHGGGGSGTTEQDARTVAFGRAKDQAGKIARASMSSIAENVASRGISGSGIEALQSAGAIGGAGESLQNLTANQMTSDFNRAGQVEDMRYQGDITQRGQDMAQRQSYLGLLRGMY